LILALLVALVAAVLFRRWSAFEKEVEAELAKIRESKQPVRLEDLQWYYPSPAPAHDTTKPMLEAIVLLPKRSSDRSQFQKMAANWFGLDLSDKPPGKVRQPKPADVERCLRENRRCIEAIEEVAAKEGMARYSIDAERGDVDLLKRLQAAAYLSSLQAYSCAERGDAQEAARAIRAIFGLAQSLERDPRLLCFLMRHSIEANGCRAVSVCIPRTQFSRDALADFDKALAHADEPAEIEAAFCGERLSGIVLLGKGFQEQSTAGLWGRVVAREERHDFAQYLRYWEEILVCVKQPWPASARAAEQLSKRWDEVVRQESLPITEKSKFALYSLIEGSEKAIAIKNATRVVIAVERYRQDHHSPPKSLDNLMPDYVSELPHNPFSGKPFNFTVNEQGLLVYGPAPEKSDGTGSEDIRVRVRYSNK
jgi:hypothetical protein